jgi:hypothetical protein
MYKHRKNEVNKNILIYKHEYDLIQMCIREYVELLHLYEKTDFDRAMIETLISLSAVLEDRWYEDRIK